MVKRTIDPKKRLARLLAEAVPRPDQLSMESKRLASFHRPRFGAKSMAVALGLLAWHSSDRAVVAASAGDFGTAERELSEAFRRTFWAEVIAPGGSANASAAVLLEAAARGVGVGPLKSVVRELRQDDRH